jgi:hypothetical protein
LLQTERRQARPGDGRHAKADVMSVS